MATCDYCGKEVVNPFTCNYCGGTFCSKHRLPPNHECPNIKDWKSSSPPSIQTSERADSVKARKGRISARQKPKKKEDSWWSKVKGVGIAVSIFAIFLVFTFALTHYLKQSEHSYLEQSEYPFANSDYYYETAENYVQKNYQIPEEKNIQGLANFLNQVELPEYSEDYFDCSESSAILEWMLEGAGFHAKLASNSRLGEMILNSHMWVMAYLEDDRRVAIEATYLTSDEDIYYPPGIIGAPDGDFEYYSYESYFERRNPNKYLTGGLSLGWSPGPQMSYSPEVLYETPKTPVEGITTDNGYMEDSSYHYYMSEDEFDWWNSHPYSSTNPFSSWD